MRQESIDLADPLAGAADRDWIRIVSAGRAS